MNCLLIAGEKSGEEHALSFYKDLTTLTDLRIWGVGGDQLQKLGMELLYHLKDFSSWGFSGVIRKIPFYLNALNRIEVEAIRRGCKVAILIDFQDFNMRLAKRLHKRGIKILYYVAPQAWVWKAYRVKILQEVAHILFTIIPFEKEWFRARGVERVVGVIHPVAVRFRQEIALFTPRNFRDFTKKIRLLILPGSRDFEVKGLLPIFIEAAKLLKQRFPIETTLVKTNSIDESLYLPYLEEVDRVFASEELALALKDSDLAIAASGTITLASALFCIPTVVCYKVSWFNWLILKLIIKYRGPASLANIVHEKMVFPELLQSELRAERIEKLVTEWLTDQNEYEKIVSDLKKTSGLLKGDFEAVGPYMKKMIEDIYAQ